jgi:MFS family permease
MQRSLTTEPARLTAAQWLVLATALLGWMFDGVEMGLFPVVAPSALADLLGAAAKDQTVVGQWNGYLTAWFLVGAACGGLVFGWLGDRIGRVRSMAVSIFAYSLFTGACYFATQPWQLGVLRFFAALGMGGEWALGVALVMESWPERFRPLLAGVIGAAGNCGYLLIAAITTRFPPTPDNWRWTMLICMAPALLAVVVLLFIPESERWRTAVRTSAARPLREIFTTRLLRPALLAIGLASVALIGTWGCVQAFLPLWANNMAMQLTPPDHSAKGATLLAISFGAILGGLIGPLIGHRVGRRAAYFGLCAASLAACQILFQGFDHYDRRFLLMCGVTGFCTASFYGWLPLYLPELFPSRVRATAQGLSYNFGRLFAAAGALGTGALLSVFGGSDPQAYLQAYPRACGTISFVYLIGMFLIWFGPETRGQSLPE